MTYVRLTTVENGKRIETEFSDVEKYAVKGEPKILKVIEDDCKHIYHWDNVLCLTEKLE